jgi:uncharacterized delta-60 repeat protein
VRTRRLVLLIGVACAALPGAAAPGGLGGATGGQLDQTFGIHGTETAGASLLKLGDVSGVVVQPDQKIVVAATAATAAPCPACHGNQSFVVARFTETGAYDKAFGRDGVWTQPFSEADFAYAIALQADGKLIIAGRSNGYFALVRLTAAGALDQSFGTGGIVRLPVYGHVSAIAIDRKGRIVGVGSDELYPYRPWLVFRCLPDGQLDQSFGTNGFRSTNSTDGGLLVSTLLLQPDGKVIAVGSLHRKPATGASVARYTPRGKLDRSFGKGGLATADFQDVTSYGQPRAALTPNGKILVALRAEVLEFTPSGRLDRRFGRRGIVRVNAHDREFGEMARYLSQINALAVEGRGGFLIAGGNGTDAVLARYLPDGTLDPRYGDRATVITPFGGNPTQVIALGRTNDQRLVALGSQQVLTGPYAYGHRPALARYLPRSCVVPTLARRKLGEAKRLLRHAGCPLGTVRFKKTPKRKRGFVLRQSPAAGSTLSADGAVDVVVGSAAKRS